ncbi:MAG: hypothetical protein J6S41_04745 [Clostridia bacterium]|nr:hypothetical protein [Clostridia bacterium]
MLKRCGLSGSALAKSTGSSSAASAALCVRLCALRILGRAVSCCCDLLHIVSGSSVSAAVVPDPFGIVAGDLFRDQSAELSRVDQSAAGSAVPGYRCRIRARWISSSSCRRSGCRYLYGSSSACDRIRIRSSCKPRREK